MAIGLDEAIKHDKAVFSSGRSHRDVHRLQKLEEACADCMVVESKVDSVLAGGWPSVLSLVLCRSGRKGTYRRPQRGSGKYFSGSNFR